MMKSLALMLIGCLMAARSSQGVAQQSTMTHFVAENASHSIVFRNVNELKERGDEVAAELGYNFGFTSLFSFSGSQLGVQAAADDNLPCGIMWFEPELIGEPAVKRDWKKPVAAGVAIADTRKLAESLKVDHDEFLSGMTVKRDHSAFGHEHRYYRMVGRYLWVVSHEQLYDVIQEAKPLATMIPGTRLAGLDSADVLISVSAKSGSLDRDKQMKRAEQWIQSRKDMDVVEEETLRELCSIFYEASYAILAARVDRGLELSFNVFFRKDAAPELRQRILKFSPPAEGVTLAGLPSGELLFGHAARTDAPGIQPALTAMVREHHGIWWPGWRQIDDNRFVGQLEHLKLLGLTGEIWPLTNRYKVGLYREENPAAHGLVTMAAILETDNPDRLLEELQTLAALVDRTALGNVENVDDRRETESLVRSLITQLGDKDFQKRQSATSRLVLIGEPALAMIVEARLSESREVARRATQIEKLIQKELKERRDKALGSSLLARAKPVFIYRPNAEERAGVPVDIMEIRIQEGSKLRDVLPVFAGPEWSRVRLVKSERHVAILFGSHLRRLDQMVSNIRSLERNDGVALPETPYGSPLLSTRGAEFQGSIARITRLVKGQRLTSEDLDDPELSSVGVTIEPDFLAVEWRISLPDLKSIKELGF